jgi:threonine dehydrogenase-like Zn-dependent dehydrogenase
VTDPAWSHHCGDAWRAHVLAAAGRDVCDVTGPSPRAARDWAALMRRLGVRSIAGVIGAVHGEPIPRRTAMRGDIVLRGWAIGICRGDRAEFYGGEMVEMKHVDLAWAFTPRG